MNDQDYMQEALCEAKEAYAKGEIPIGAVIVQNGQIIARNHNRREELHDPTAHAEVLVMREAGKIFGGWRLPETTLYVTIEPCPMCAGALVQARVSRVVYGARDLKAGAVHSLYGITADERLNHCLEITAGVLEDEAREIMQQFFQSRRKRD